MRSKQNQAKADTPSKQAQQANKACTNCKLPDTTRSKPAESTTCRTWIKDMQMQYNSGNKLKPARQGISIATQAPRKNTQRRAVTGMQNIGNHAYGPCHCSFVTTLEQCTATAQCRKLHTTNKLLAV
jgi:hypothetical protein